MFGAGGSGMYHNQHRRNAHWKLLLIFKIYQEIINMEHLFGAYIYIFWFQWIESMHGVSQSTIYVFSNYPSFWFSYLLFHISASWACCLHLGLVENPTWYTHTYIHTYTSIYPREASKATYILKYKDTHYPGGTRTNGWLKGYCIQSSHTVTIQVLLTEDIICSTLYPSLSIPSYELFEVVQLMLDTKA